MWGRYGLGYRNWRTTSDLFRHLTNRLSSGPRRGISPQEPHWARRLGWYALVRATQPAHVVETGTHLGLGSCAIAAALLRNGHGRLTTIDVDPEAGYLIGGRWASVIERRTGSSIDLLAGLNNVDIFLHDSLHTYAYESRELAAVERSLSEGAIVLSDNAHDSAALSDWAERAGRHYLFFSEQPGNHWWPGDGIGASWPRAGQGHGSSESTGRSAGRLADEEVNGLGGPGRSTTLTDRPDRLLEDFPVPVGAAVADAPPTMSWLRDTAQTVDRPARLQRRELPRRVDRFAARPDLRRFRAHYFR